MFGYLWFRALLALLALFTLPVSLLARDGPGREQARRGAAPVQGSERLPDPRFRPPLGKWELDRVASMVAGGTGLKVNGRISLARDPGAPFASIRGGYTKGELYLNPLAAQQVPPNTWAFVIAHEFAHQIMQDGRRGQTTPETELRADILGARYAQAAGFDLAAHLGWVLSRPDGGSSSHGSSHQRAFQLANHYRIPIEVIDAHSARYLDLQRREQRVRR